MQFCMSDLCCYKLKKENAHRYQEESGRTITLTGIRAEEGGMRTQGGCTVFDEGKLVKFHPLKVVDENWENKFIEKYNIELCKLYKAPYNFKRTGCRGCPFALNLQEELDIMSQHLPLEKKICENLWKPVYEEYRKIGYRLRKRENQISFFD